MIINWLLYSVLVAGILAIAGVAFEYGARALRLPTRWVWTAVMVLSTLFSALTLAKGFVTRASSAPATEYAVPAAGSAIDSDSVPVRVWSARESARVRPWNRTKPTPLQPVIAAVLNSTGGLPAAIGVDEGSFRSFDTPLLVACSVLALLGMVTLAVTFARLSGVAYALDHAVVEGVPVLLSRNIGPALLGVTRFRVVLPRWVTEMPAADVRTILAHEQEHALAGDPTLTLGALVMVALQPWNPALWFALSRLRLATEADCDARVLGVDGDVRRYGHLLVNVYQRAQSGPSPLTSFVTRTSQLEARIRRLVSAAPKSFSAKTVGAFAVALMLCTLAHSLEVTAQRASTAQRRSAIDSAPASAAAPRKLSAADSARIPIVNHGRFVGKSGLQTPEEAQSDLRRAISDLRVLEAAQREKFTRGAPATRKTDSSRTPERQDTAAHKTRPDTSYYAPRIPLGGPDRNGVLGNDREVLALLARATNAVRKLPVIKLDSLHYVAPQLPNPPRAWPPADPPV